MLWQMVTMVVNPLPDVIFKNSAFLVASSVCCQKLLVIQIVRDHGEWGKKVVPYLIAKVCNGHNGYVLKKWTNKILLKCFVCAQAHSAFVLKHITSYLFSLKVFLDIASSFLILFTSEDAHTLKVKSQLYSLNNLKIRYNCEVWA